MCGRGNCDGACEVASHEHPCPVRGCEAVTTCDGGTGRAEIVLCRDHGGRQMCVYCGEWVDRLDAERLCALCHWDVADAAAARADAANKDAKEAA